MTPPALIPSSVPDLRAVPLGKHASPVAVDEALRRVLPDRPVVSVPPGQEFGSFI